MIGKKVIRLNEVDSTNNYAKGLVMHKEAEEGTVVLAYSQVIGRGYVKNNWESEAGKNLTFSLVLCPQFVKPANQFAISMAVALGIYDFISPLVGQVTIKWPNDIYVGNKKVCGMLIENMVQGDMISESIIGIGLNLNQEEFSPSIPNPVSLTHFTKIVYDIENCLMHLCFAIEKRYFLLKEKGIGPTYDDYVGHLYKKGEWAGYIANGHKFRGKIVGIDRIGRLLVENDSGGISTFNFKEIEYIN